MDAFTGNSPHQPLSQWDPSEIRLVKLHPGELDDPVRCELYHTSLDKQPVHDYIALSYTWGDPNDTVPICLNGVDYPVTRNLDSFLRHAQKVLLAVSRQLAPGLRRGSSLLIHTIARKVLEAVSFSANFPFETDEAVDGIIHRNIMLGISQMRERHGSLKGDEEPLDSSEDPGFSRCFLYFWIDAVCINQQDPTERSREVARMKNIYSQAPSLFIWFGALDKYTSGVAAALRLIQELGDLARETYFTDEEAAPFDMDGFLEHVTREDFVGPRLGAVQQLREILRDDWFTRVWIIQELASAKGIVTAWVGFHQIQWNVFFHFLVPAFLEMAFKDLEGNQFMFFSDIKNLIRLDHIWKSQLDTPDSAGEAHISDSNLDIARQLNELLQQTCGAFKATDPRDQLYALLGLLRQPRIPDDLQPDYSLAVERVYHRYAAFLLEHTKDLRILDFQRRQITGVPSWVPDWRFLRTGVMKGDQPQTLVSNLHVSPDRSKMRLEGVHLGRVVAVIHPTAIVTGLEGLTLSVDPQVMDDERIEARYRAVIQAFQALKRECLEELHRSIPTASPDDFTSIWLNFWRPHREDLPFYTTMELLEGIREFSLDYYEILHRIVMVKHQVIRLAMGGIAILDNGYLASIARMDGQLRPRDDICMFKGAQRPSVIRPEGGHFSFVGYCANTSFQLEGPDESFFKQRGVKEFNLV